MSLCHCCIWIDELSMKSIERPTHTSIVDTIARSRSLARYI